MKKAIHSPQAPAAIGPYSQAVGSAHLTVLSGQLGIDPHTGHLVAGGVKEQTEQVLKNIAAILKESGHSQEDVVKTTVFLTDMSDFAAMNEVYARFFTEPFPARSTVAVRSLPKNALVEIEVLVF
ncbi:MAG: RidA family protein [Dysgonamonadaceae bacterium]|jgi:2-iminobutanoate/2-iminopropanoate deaminase|nr:RidA family protein [Dysgonamonadaceae bacterium]